MGDEHHSILLLVTRKSGSKRLQKAKANGIKWKAQRCKPIRSHALYSDSQSSIASRSQLGEERKEEIESYCDGEDVASGAEGHEDGARPAAAASHRRGPRACSGGRRCGASEMGRAVARRGGVGRLRGLLMGRICAMPRFQLVAVDIHRRAPPVRQRRRRPPLPGRRRASQLDMARRARARPSRRCRCIVIQLKVILTGFVVRHVTG